MKTVKELFKPKSKVVYSVLESSIPSRLEEMIIRVASKYAEKENLSHVTLAPNTTTYKNKIVQEHLNRISSNVEFISEEDMRSLTKNNIVVCSTAAADHHKFSASTIAVDISNNIEKSIQEGDLNSFRSQAFSSLLENDCKLLINYLRESLDLDPISFDVKFVTNELREKYFNKQIFNIGDIVESHEGEVYEILNRGSNYVMVVDSSGATKREWITNIVESTKSLADVDPSKFSFKGFIPKNINEDARLAEMFKTISESSNDPYLVLITLKLVENFIEYSSSSARLQECLDKIGLCLTEDQVRADYKTDKRGKKYRAGRITFKNSKDSEEDEKIPVKESSVSTVNKGKSTNLSSSIVDKKDVEKLSTGLKTGVEHSKVGHSLESNNDHLRKMKVKFATEEKEPDNDEDVVEPIDLSDEDIDKAISTVDDWDDVIDAYDDDEFVFVDQDGNVDKDKTNEDAINEVLSRMERIKARIRFAKTASKRERLLKIALKRRSSTKTINSRARKLAIKMLKMKIAKKSLDKLSVPEKERLERIIERSKTTLNRMAMKLTPKIRKIENDRLSHPAITKDADKNA